MNRKPAIELDHATRVMIEVIMQNDWHPADTVREQFGIELADVEDQLFQPYDAPVEAAAPATVDQGADLSARDLEVDPAGLAHA